MTKQRVVKNKKEIWAGMCEADKFFAARPHYKNELVRFFGEQVWTRRNGSARGIGFRRMAYIISQERAT